MRTTSQDTALSLLHDAATEFACTGSVAERFPTFAEYKTKSGKPMAEIVATGELAIAETGSVLVDQPADDRGACFLAERLWLLVPAREIVATLAEVLRRIPHLTV